jgi:hypothetical protein
MGLFGRPVHAGASFVAQDIGYLGTSSLGTGNGGSVGWTFSVAASAPGPLKKSADKCERR